MATFTILVFSELARIEAPRGVRTLAVALREELVDQARTKLEALGLWGGVEQERRGSSNEPVVVATPQTLRGERLARDAFGYVVVQEDVAGEQYSRPPR